MTSAKKKTSSDGYTITYESTAISIVGKSISVLDSPSRRITNDVPTSEKKSETELVAWPKKPMKRAKSSALTYCGCFFAITFISKSSTVTTTSKRHVIAKMPITYGCLSSSHSPSTRPVAPLSGLAPPALMPRPTP